MRALQAAPQEIDPATELFRKVEPYLGDIPILTGDAILMAIYKRPEKTKGGIFLTDKTTDEDIWQGKVGLILKMGPLAFKPDAEHDYSYADGTPAVTPKVGDWAVFRVGDAWPLVLGDTPCRVATEKAIRMTVARPDIIM